jgi:PAS domain S-box-containing protein
VWERYGVSVATILAATLVRLSLYGVLGDRVVFATYIVAVLVASLYGGWGPGLVATVLSTLVADLVFLHPKGSLAISSSTDQQSAVIFFGISLCIVVVSEAFRRASGRAETAAKEARTAQDAQKMNEVLATKRLAELEILYNLTPVGLAFVDPNSAIVRINDRLQQWMGATDLDLIGKKAGEILGAPGQTIQRSFDYVIKTGKPLRQEVEWKLADGEPRYYLANFDPVFGADAAVLGVNLVVYDLTERKDAEVTAHLLAEATTTLASSLNYERTLEQLAQAAVPDFADWCGVDVLDEDGTLKRVAVKHIDPEKVKWAMEIERKYPPDPNAATGSPAVLRTGKAELYKDIPRELLVAAAIDDEHMRLIDELGLTSVIIVPLVSRGKVLGVLSLVWAESRKHYDEKDLAVAEELGRRAGTAVDNARLFEAAQRELRDRKKAEEEVRRLNIDLEKRVEERTAALRATMDELEGFCYSVSHDLRAPMRSLSGNSRILIEDFGGQLDGEARDHLHRISIAATKMGELIDDLLQFSRLGRTELSFRDVNLSDLANAAATAYRAQNPDANFEIEIEPDAIACGDPNVLGLAMQNLIENALKYSSKVASPKVQFGVRKRAEETIYFVKDNGVGFDMKYAPKIFQPFERLHRDSEYPGTGIGLANVKRVVARHGGQIWVEAAPNQGATFSFTLGARCDENAPASPATMPSYMG